MLIDLQSDRIQQLELGQEDKSARDRTRLMMGLDAVNTRYGKGTLQIGNAGMPDPTSNWTMKQMRRTPRYTTDVRDLVVVKA